ncbi:MAG: hypothetical protein JNL74_06630, partial [Fibrobacteres bacterium]|nr:hypothetical protein [Fibrobacterota bacterium]
MHKTKQKGIFLSVPDRLNHTVSRLMILLWLIQLAFPIGLAGNQLRFNSETESVPEKESIVSASVISEGCGLGLPVITLALAAVALFAPEKASATKLWDIGGTNVTISGFSARTPILNSAQNLHYYKGRFYLFYK